MRTYQSVVFFLLDFAVDGRDGEGRPQLSTAVSEMQGTFSQVLNLQPLDGKGVHLTLSFVVTLCKSSLVKFE